MILPFFLAFVALAICFAVLEYRSTRLVMPSHPHADLLMRERAAQLRVTERDNSTQRGERARPNGTDLLDSFDPTYFTAHTCADSNTTNTTKVSN